ncbi:hypothetical protein SDC9_44477 [bioreactor metagenome]|jgi:hypothetical protein|uniref:Uncharacterized protein n=1 Tax=bioreactor metagenome TaxID=1076179 RepID=A0A644W3W0_9ZZZZ
MSNNKKNRTDGTIPMKNKDVATPVNSNNTSSSAYEYTDLENIARVSKSNQKR